MRTVTTSLQPNGSKPAAEVTIISTNGKSRSDEQKAVTMLGKAPWTQGSRANPWTQGRIAHTWHHTQQRTGAVAWKRHPQIWDESTMDIQWFCTGVAQPHDKPKMGEDVKPVAFPTKHTTGFLTRFSQEILGFPKKGFPGVFQNGFPPDL